VLLGEISLKKALELKKAAIPITAPERRYYAPVHRQRKTNKRGNTFSSLLYYSNKKIYEGQNDPLNII
jgi:hypothetical protein